MSASILLTRGLHAIVDDRDHHLVAGHKWQAVKSGRTFYAYNAKLGMMHRFLLGFTNPKIRADHENHNGLDNRRSNIRLATQPQNMANRRKFNGPTMGSRESQYKGVSPRGKKWAAYIGTRRMYLGLFPTPELAARAYDAKAVELYGEFACLNFPSPFLPASGRSIAHMEVAA